MTGFDYCIKDLYKRLQSDNPDLEVMFFQSDGCSSQFKGRNTFNHMTKFKRDTAKGGAGVNGARIVWWFFASCHGKGSWDGEGGVVKHIIRHSAKADSFYNSIEEIIAFLKEHAQVPDTTDAGLKDRLKSAEYPLWRRHFIHVDLHEVQKKRNMVDTVKLGKTMKYHAFSLPTKYEKGKIFKQILACACSSCITNYMSHGHSKGGGDCSNQFLGDWRKLEAGKIKLVESKAWRLALISRDHYQLKLLKELSDKCKEDPNYFKKNKIVLAFEAEEKWKAKGYEFYLGRIEDLQYVPEDGGDCKYSTKSKKKEGKNFFSGTGTKRKKWIMPVGKFAIKAQWYLNYENDANPESSIIDDGEGGGRGWYYLDENTPADWISSESVLLETDLDHERKVEFYAGFKNKRVDRKKAEEKRESERPAREGVTGVRRSSRVKNAGGAAYYGYDVEDDDIDTVEETQYKLSK